MKILLRISRFAFTAIVKPSTASVKKKRSIRSCALWLIPLFLGVIIGGILGYFVPRALLKPTENSTSTNEGPLSSSTEKRYAFILQKLYTMQWAKSAAFSIRSLIRNVGEIFGHIIKIW